MTQPHARAKARLPYQESGGSAARRLRNQGSQKGAANMNFRILGLPSGDFTHLFGLSDAELAAQGGVRRVADGNYPCRVSLTDSEPGDELLLVNYEHHPVDSPYRMRFAIYVREGDRTYDRVNEIPEQLRTRMLAVRSFDENGMMVARSLAEGRELEAAIEQLLAPSNAAYLHVHFAAAG